MRTVPAQQPDSTEAPEGVTDPPPADPFPDDPCIGPPPFAGSEPAGDTEAEREANRAAEAEAFTAFRDENCPDDPQVGPRASRPAGPPEGLPAGPPEETQAGPPAETPAGPPEGTPAGPPDGLPPG